MSAPVPAPRSLGNDKRPVPTPRRLIPIQQQNDETQTQTQKAEESKSNETNTNMNTNTNSFSRRVRTLSHTSKQIAEDIGGIVQGGKKVVLESTRQSVRNIKRRFTTAAETPTLEQEQNDKKDEELETGSSLSIFDTIRFNSPLNTLNSNIYNNVNPPEAVSSLESEPTFVRSYPPPNYPPPPLRQESVYDEPQSVISGSTSSSGSLQITTRNPGDYESVFPLFAYMSDTDSCADSSTQGTIDRKVDLSRSASWAFYDSVSKAEENVYNNIDGTPVLEAVKQLDICKNDETDVNSNSSVDGSAMSSLMRNNSVYENHEITLRTGNDNNIISRPTQSVILQFDPLTSSGGGEQEEAVSFSGINNNQCCNNNQNALQELEQLLQGDLYNTITTNTYDNWSMSNESETEEYINPPTPPTRYDSLPEDIPPPTPTVIKEDKSRSTFFTSSDSSINSNTNNLKTNSKNENNETPSVSSSTNNNHNNSSEPKKKNWLAQVNNVLKKAPEIVKGVKSKESVFLQRPALVPKCIVNHKGMLYRVTSGPVEDLFGEYNSRWCVLSNNCFTCYGDATCDSAKENFPMSNILSIQVLAEHKFKYENEDLHCFELNTSGKSRGGYFYGSRSILETRVWMQRIAESLTNRFGSQILCEYSRLGWAYVREGVSGQWFGAWIVLVKRTLYYAIDNSSVRSMDLRKARCIGLQNPLESDGTPKTSDKGPNMLVDCPSGALYLRMWSQRETKMWCHVVKYAAHNNGPKLEEQQLTKNDIPVLVEKCINFIYAYGSMTEGIYRRAGSGSTVNDILTQFRKDAWAVQLTMDKYSEHDVATALKRFFRDLPEPLFTNNKRQYLYQVSKVNNQAERIRMYKAAIDQFSSVTQNTVRKLLGHLHFIKTQSIKNLMNIDNLASVWGPTLMHYENNDDPQQDSVVVAQLITFYPHLFPENAKEMEQEKVMLQVLERYANSSQGGINTKTTGDFRVWVYFHNRDGETCNVAIGPKKTAYEICVELSSKIKLPVHELQLEELVLNDALVRPIHHTEKVLDVVLKWGYWDEGDRKDNILVLGRIAKYWEYIQDKTTSPILGELKYADNKSKNFKLHMFEFSQAKLNYYKDKSCNNKVGSWNIEDITWYFGYESKRNPPSRWTITFMAKNEHPKRTKSSPWFGNVLAWTDPGLRAKWITAMMRAEHPNDLTPPPQHVNLMTH